MKNSPFGHPAWIEIDLVQFKKNIAYIKKFIGSKTKFCLPVKANAYGHGLIPIAQAAAQAGVDYLGVSCLQEGALLRQANIKLPILVFGAIHTEQIKELIHYGLEFTIASLFKAKMVKDICEGLNKTVKVHLEIDTGMLRTGVRVTTGIEVLNFLKKHSCFKVKGIYSHLATADDLKNDFTLRQIELFKNFIADCELDKKSDYICHLANSAGLINFPTSHFEMVRPGLLA
ncbi:MAG: alr, partial [Francisellaceae bacterium]|nr:alr [Francisellaceae bacterium]